MVTRTKENLLYSLLALLAVLVFLVVRFPGEEVLAFLDARVKAVHPGLSLAAERISLWPPLGLRLTGFELAGPEGPARVVFKAASLHAAPRLADLLRDTSGVNFWCAAYGGTIRGQLRSRQKLAGPFGAEIRLDDIDLGKGPSLAALAGCKISGHAAGVVNLADLAGLPPAGSGKAELTVTDGRFELSAPVLGVGAVSFKELGATATLADRKVHLDLELKGPEFSGALAGSVILAAELRNSRLDLKGSMEPAAAFLREQPEIGEGLKSFKKHLKNGRYSFTVSGTIQEPKFQLI